MAGDWIKIQHVTPDKPEIYRLANILGVTPEDAFGRCVRIWIWADQQSLNGHEISVTLVTLDSISRHTGFGSALAQVGWLVANEDGTVSFPNFNRHNGETAKTRADAANRKKKQREKESSNVTDMSQQIRDETVTREEKRREESKPSFSLRSEDPPPDFIQQSQAKDPPKKAAQLPADFYPNETGVSYAEDRRINLVVELESFRNWHMAKGSTMKDWQAAWRTWCDKAVGFGRATVQAKPIGAQGASSGLSKAGQKTAEAAARWLQSQEQTQ